MTSISVAADNSLILSEHHEKCLYNVDPLKPHFYKVKLGFTGVYIIFLISAQKHRLIRKLILRNLGPVVQSIVSLTSSLVVKMLTVLVSIISNSQIFLVKKCEYLLQITFFFTKNISVYAIFNDQSFNDTLTNDIVSFEQMGPALQHQQRKHIS